MMYCTPLCQVEIQLCFISSLTNLLPLSVDKARPQFKTWVETAHSTHRSEIQLKSNEFQDATPESMFRFLKRIKIVIESRSIYQDTIAGKCFVGILGAEDIGKSTFIRVSKYPPFCGKLTTNPRLSDHSYLMNCSHYSSSVHHCACVCNILRV
jgi:hypothetical protein